MHVGRDVEVPLGGAQIFRVGNATVGSGTMGSSIMAKGSSCAGAICTLGDVAGSASTLGGGAIDSMLFPGLCSFVALKMLVRARSWSIPLVARGGGMFPLSARVKFFAACTMASAGVTVGDVMYLCLKTTDSEPRFAFVSANQPK